MTILENIKEALGVHSEDNAFDAQLTIILQTVSALLQQLGVTESYVDLTLESSWDAFQRKTREEGKDEFGLVKTYVLLYTQLAFDPPTGSVLTYQKDMIEELKWRIKEAYTGDYLDPSMKGGTDEGSDE